MRRPGRESNSRIEILQISALPLGYQAVATLALLATELLYFVELSLLCQSAHR